MRGSLALTRIFIQFKGEPGRLGVSLLVSQSLSVFAGQAEALKTAMLCLGTKAMNAGNVHLGLHPRTSEMEVLGVEHQPPVS